MKTLLFILISISLLINTAYANNIEDNMNDMNCHMNMTMDNSIEFSEEDCCECDNCNICILNISFLVNNYQNILIKQSETYLYSFGNILNKTYLLYRPPKLV